MGVSQVTEQIVCVYSQTHNYPLTGFTVVFVLFRFTLTELCSHERTFFCQCQLFLICNFFAFRSINKVGDSQYEGIYQTY